MAFDYLIVGAGSAGAVLAGRLSEQAHPRILLLEAGPDYSSRTSAPADLLDSRNLAGMAHDWHYTAAPVLGRSIPCRRGRVVGGASAINAAAAQWGRPEDFAQAARCGNPDRCWQHVEPYFRKLETDRMGPPGRHGECGPVPINRYMDDELIPIQRAFRDACLEAGFPAVRDHNALDEDTVASDEGLDNSMHAQIGTYCHALGTARMGPGHEPGAVVDARCRVHGTQGPWVVDASVMPAVPRVVPNLTVMMIAERVADAFVTEGAMA